MRLALPTALFAALMFTACGGGADAALPLPPEDSFFLPSPTDDTSGLSSASAVCASDTEAWDALRGRIEAYNEELQGMKAAIRALRLATARQLEREGEAEITVERENLTVSLLATVAEDESVDYAVDVTPTDEETRRVLDGTMDADGNGGTWDVYRRDGETAVSVIWSRDDNDVVTVERTAFGFAAERTSVYTRDGDAITVVFTGPNHGADAEWDLATRAGSVTVDGEARLCFEAGEEEGDLCTVDCPG